MGNLTKHVTQTMLDARIAFFIVLAVVGLYVCLYLIGEAVWELTDKIELLTQTVTDQ